MAAYIVGVGLTPFVKPDPSRDYAQLAVEACQQSLADAGIKKDAVAAAVTGYNYGEPTSGHRVIQELGIGSVPVFPINSNCSTGSSALFLARELVLGGRYECVLAVGFEKMERSGLSYHYLDRPHPEASLTASPL
jgi:sterol carrier protein 2